MELRSVKRQGQPLRNLRVSGLLVESDSGKDQLWGKAGPQVARINRFRAKCLPLQAQGGPIFPTPPDA